MRVKPQNPIRSPRRSAMPTATTFAEAPTSVPFPPRQAPSASAHQSGSTLGCAASAASFQAGQLREQEARHREGERDQGGHGGDVVDDGRGDAANHRSTRAATKGSLLVSDTAPWAICCRRPISSIPPTTMKRPTKKKIVGHSTSEST